MTANGKIVSADTIKFAERLPFRTGDSVTADIQPAQNGSPRYPTPAELVEQLRRLPPVADEDVAELMRMIDEDKSPPSDRGCFDDLPDDE